LEREKLAILKDMFGGYYRSSSEYLFNCPKCNHHKPKLSINISKGVFKCWICDYSGTTLYRLVRRYGSYNQKQAWRKYDNVIQLDQFESVVRSLFETEEVEVEESIKLPEEFVSLVNKDLPYSALPARKYLRDRGITKEQITYWKIGYCPIGEYKDRIIIPSFNMDGRVNFFVGRTYIDNWRKYMNPKVRRNSTIFNHLFLDFQNDLIITEGIFDAIIAGPNAVPILGSTLKEDSKLFQEVIKNDTPIYIALDVDAEKKAMRLVESFLKYGVELYKIDISPYRDVAEMTKDEFLRRKKEASFLTYENYLSYKINNLL